MQRVKNRLADRRDGEIIMPGVLRNGNAKVVEHWSGRRIDTLSTRHFVSVALPDDIDVAHAQINRLSFFHGPRDIGAVADLNDAGNPAVLALIAHTVEAGKRRGVEVSLCGDAAADTRLTTALLGTGLTTLSVSPIAVARLKAAIAKVRS